jgi:integrase/recombinase XerD
VISLNPLKQLPMFINDTEVHYLNKRDSQRLVNSIKKINHKLIVLLMLDCGMRVSEAISLKLNDFDFKRKTVRVRSLKKRTKTKYRTIPLSSRLYNVLADYLYKNKFDYDSFLFPSDKTNSGHIIRQGVNHFLERYKNSLNIRNLHPHTLRHTCATSHLAQGVDLVHIKELLGHENLNTTTIYTHIPEEILRNSIEKAAAVDEPFFKKIAKKWFSTKKELLISMPTENNLPAIGRASEIEKVQSFINRDINTIILGPVGVGKSHLLSSIISDNKKILRLDDCDNIKRSLILLLIYLYKNEKEAVFNLLYGDYDLEKLQIRLNRDSVRGLCDEIKKVVEQKEYILRIDTVDRITPKSIKALEELKDTFTIFTTARNISLNKGSFLWNFEIVHLNNLSRQASLELINRLSYDLSVEDYELFKNHIYEQSNGNPRVIFELVERYRKEPVITSDVVRDIRHFGSLKEIDMSLMIIIFLASLAILRYVSREIDNDSYRLLGGVAMILLIISRYFFRYSKRKFI